VGFDTHTCTTTLLQTIRAIGEYYFWYDQILAPLPGDKSARNPKRGGILELKGETELAQRMDAIVKRLDALSVGKPVNAAKTFPVESCFICASPMHQAQNCPSMTVFVEMEQVNAFNNFQKPSSGPYSETYNPGWRNHPNFFWK
jgi:hypothetical protein